MAVKGLDFLVRRLYSDIRQVEFDGMRVFRNVASYCLINFFARNPVLTTRSRQNWVTTLNSSPAPTYAKTHEEFLPLDPIGEGLKTIFSANPGDTVFITNDAPYIQRLELHHWSKQVPPQGWIRLIVLAAGNGAADSFDASGIRRPN